jgi:hypothetical protein
MKRSLIISTLFIFLLSVATYKAAIYAASTSIVIGEFRTRGPDGANDEFIELVNISPSTIDISGWRVIGTNGSDTTATRAIINNGSFLPPGCHYLLTNSNTNGYSGSVPTNQTYGVGITDDGGIAIVTATGFIVDQVGMSNGSIIKEGTPLGQLTTNTNRSYERRPTGANSQDTDNNQADFILVSPSNPQNSLSCSGGDPNFPSGTAMANPSTITQGGESLYTVSVTPGNNPVSSSITVLGNLTVYGGSQFQKFFDDGTNGDDVAGDSIYSYRATIPVSAPTGTFSLPISIIDNLQRGDFTNIQIIIKSSVPIPECGVERWSVKTGTDADASMIDLLNILPVTVATMRSWTAPNPIPSNSRFAPYEKTVYVVNATLTKYKLEEDSDYHLVLEDGQGNTIISEVVCSCCVGVQSPFLNAIAEVRNQFDARLTATTSFQNVSIPVRVTGVGFFDFLHGQTGVAPNGIEIHPILNIAFDVDLHKPHIVSAFVKGKKLFVRGLNFAEGAVILMDGEKQKTLIDDENPSTVLIGKKAGNFIVPGQMVTLQIRLADGTLSDGFPFRKQ